MSQEDLSKVKKDLLSETEPPPKPPGESPTPSPDPPREISREAVANMLKLPFSVGRLMTRYEGFQINPLLEKDIIDSGYQVCKDFGIELYGKWVNLIFFGGMYGASVFGAFVGYSAWIKSKGIPKIEKKEKQKDDDPSPPSDSKPQTG